MFVLVALFLGGAAFINSLSVLECHRRADAPGKTGGDCTLRRGSWAFDYTERFFVSELRGAVISAGAAMPNARLDGPGTRVYVDVAGEHMRFLDNDAWTDADRRQMVAQVDRFVADSHEADLLVRFDRRPVLLGQAFAAGVLVGGAWSAAKLLRRRRP
jgi:hypothetical protein